MTFTMRRDLFLQELAIGSKWAEHAAAELNAMGIPCEATEMRVAQTEEEIKEFTEHDQDVVLLDGSGHFEVKSRRLNFHYHPFTYPFETAFVDTVSGWEQKLEKPLAVLLVSQQTGKIMVIPPESREHWKTTTTFDNVRGFTDTWYVVPKEHMMRLDTFVERMKNGSRA